MTYRFSRLSIRTQLFMLVLIALAPAFAAFIKGLVDERLAARTAAQAQLKVEAQLMATRLGAYFADNEGVLAKLAQRPHVRQPDGRHCDPILKEYVALHPEFTNIVVRDLAGTNACSVLASAMPQAQALAFPWFVQALQSDVAKVSDAFVGPQSGRWVAMLSHPLRDDSGKKTGLLLLPTDLLQLNRKLLGSTPSEIIFTVTDGARKIVLRSVEPEKWIGQPPPAISTATQGQAEGVAAGPGLDGVRRLFAFTQVPKVGWRVVAGVREDVAYAASDAAFRRGILIRLGVLLLALALAWWMGRAMVRPIESLARTVKRLLAGDTSARAPQVHGPAEIEAMTQGFNQMLQAGDERQRALLGALAELQASEERFRNLTRLSSDWYWEQDAEFRFVRMDGELEINTGIAAADHIGRTRWDMPALNMSAGDWEAHQSVLRAHLPFHDLEMRRPDRAGRMHWVSISGAPIFDAQGHFTGYRGVGADISARKQAQAALATSLLEKVALLKEVHHRVKNNLQVITSLLRLEAGRSEVPDTRAVLADMQGRIRSMALLHESLYRAGTFAAVDLGGYLTQLATQAFRTQVTQPGAVRLELDLAAVNVGMDQAAPCGLLVNELISNALKHGFADGRSGEVRVELHLVDGGPQVRLRVSDTGVGLARDFEARRNHSLGLQLVSDLAGQIGGTLQIEPRPGPGAAFSVTFVADEPRPPTPQA